jgi:very-short-patch-repair endonuclease
VGPREAEERLAALQRRQHGVFTRAQAIRCGVRPTTVDGRRRIGRYRVLLPGVMVDAGTPDRWVLRAMAALLWVGGEAVLARGSAARAHGLALPPSHDERLRVLVRSRCPAAPADVVVHRTSRWSDDDLTSVGPLRVTTVSRTICDLAGELGPVALRRLVAEAVRSGGTDASSLRATMVWMGRFRGAVALRRLVAELSPLDAACASELEHAYLRLARAHGIEPTAMNHVVRDADGRRRVLDVVHLPERVWIELDGAAYHDGVLDRADDLRRTEAILRAGGWRAPLRFTWEDVHERPGHVVAEVRSALTAARTPPPIE